LDELLTQLPGHELFYEFHSNESSDTEHILFHALGAWRIAPAYHDVLWNPPFVMAASQLLGDVPVRFWHDQLFYKPAKKGGVVAWHQDYSYWTRTNRLPISPAGAVWTIQRPRTDASNMCPAAIGGVCSTSLNLPEI
jgi:hypothetical protein